MCVGVFLKKNIFFFIFLTGLFLDDLYCEGFCFDFENSNFVFEKI